MSRASQGSPLVSRGQGPQGGLACLRRGAGDIVLSGARWGVSAHFAWGEIRARYSRSVLGPFWLLLNTAVSVACLSFIYSMLFHQSPRQMVPSITVGLVVWQLLAACVSEASAAFTYNAHYIRNIPGPLSSFLLVLLLRQAIIFAHHLVIVVVVLALYPPEWGWPLLLVLPGLVLVAANLAWMSLFLAVAGARFRDLEHTISSVMPLLFLVSPVIYRPHLLEGGQLLVWANPFSYLITLVRDPLLGACPPAFVYTVAVAFLVVGGSLSVFVFGRFHDQIPFWL